MGMDNHGQRAIKPLLTCSVVDGRLFRTLNTSKIYGTVKSSQPACG